MPEHMTDRELADEVWYWYLNGKNKVGFPRGFTQELNRLQMLHRVLPGTPRCIECEVPLAGVGAAIMKPFGYRPSVLTPLLCNGCEKMILATEGGAEVELSLLFADIRGSTAMAERQSPMHYKDFIQRFYKTAAGILIDRYALVNRLVGDQAIGLFVTRFAGPNHAKAAIEAALEILRATGHADPSGPWVPVGIGIHTGSAYVGAVGSKEGVNEIAVIGNAANLTARLSSKAAAGEVLVSEQAAAAAGLAAQKPAKRRLTLKGIARPVSVSVFTLDSQQSFPRAATTATPVKARRKRAA